MEGWRIRDVRWRISLCYFAHVCSAALCRNRTLVTLELGRNALTDTSAQLLWDALKLNFKLEGLSLWQNEISGAGAQCIAEGLQVRATISNILLRAKF